MFEFKPLPSPAQPYRDVLFFNALARPESLFETAQQRMSAALDLLQIVEQRENRDFVQHEAARLSFAAGLLLADARALYEAAHERAMEPATESG
ncbi:hypothetical protein D3C72_2159420 [compost metagenome]